MLQKSLGLIALIVLFGCSQQKVETIADLENRYTELNDLNSDLELQRNDLFKLIHEFNNNHSETEQFDISKFDTLMGAPERELLQAMFKNEQDISYNGLLKNIIAKNDEIIVLNDKITDLNEQISLMEEKLPKPYVVKNGDTQFEIVRDFLITQYGLDKKQAREIAWKTSMTDNILPGNRIWLSYDKENSIVGTFVTQGEAKIAPMTFERIAKKNMIQKAVEQANISQTTSNLQSSVTENNNIM